MNKDMLRKALWEFLKPLIQLITNILNPESGEEWLVELKKFLRKESCWTITEISKPAAPEVSDGTYIVRVDRTIRPSYPIAIFKEAFFPEFENTGPNEFDLRKVKRFTLAKQNKGKVSGRKIFDYLRKHDLLRKTLNHRDGEEIIKKGQKVFRELFGANNLLLWRSVAEHESGAETDGESLYVMYLTVHGGSVIMCARNLSENFDLRDLSGMYE